MGNKIDEKSIKTLHLSDDKFSIWIESIRIGLTSLYVTDSDLSLTYHIADFDGAKYRIKNQNMFGKFIVSCKKRPQVIRDLIKFHATRNNEGDVIDDLKVRVNCFRRRFSIYIKRRFKT